MESDPIKNDKRRAHRARRLDGDAVCAFCGVTDSRVLARLTPERILAIMARAQTGSSVTLCESDINALTGRTVIEQDHVLGRNIEPALTFPLCRNDHVIETERRRNAGISMKRPATFPELIISVIASLSQFFMSLAQIGMRWVEWLTKHIAILDRHFPEWRMLEAEAE